MANGKLDKELLEILACPRCKSPVFPICLDHGLLCRECDLVYPVRDRIPVMLIDEAVSYVDFRRLHKDNCPDESL